MSWQALAWAGKQRVGHAHSKAVLIILANYADERGTCFPSHEDLHRVLEVSVRTIQDCVKRLAEDGYISTERDRHADGRLGLTRYCLNLERQPGKVVHPPEAASEPPEAPAGGPPEAPPEETTGSSFRSDTPQESIRESSTRDSAHARGQDKTFRDLVANYPDAILDDHPKSARLYEQLSEEDRAEIWARLPAFRSYLLGKRRRPHLQDFLRDRLWELVAQPTRKAVVVDDGKVEIRRFTRAMWAMIWRYDRAGKSPLQVIAATEIRPWRVAPEIMPGKVEVERLVQVAVSGPEFAAWRDYAVGRWPDLRFRWPVPDQSQFAWMPALRPPTEPAHGDSADHVSA